mgnify:FL=1
MSGIDSYTKSCLHFQNRVWTFYGNAQIDTAQKPFGTGSLLLDGSGDYIGTVDSPDFDFGTGDFTIDFWVRRDGNINDYGGVISGTSTSDNGWNLSFGSVAGSNQNKLRFAHPNGSWGPKIVSSTVLPDTTWTHIALVRNGNTITMYQAGTSVGSVDCTGWTVDCSGTGAVIGRYYTNQDSNYFNGWLAEFRITKGLARWTSDFTPPSSAYSDDSYTMVLLHFGGSDGATYTKDYAANWTVSGAQQFYDERGKTTSYAGNISLSTSQYKWGASAYLDGTGDYLKVGTTTDTDFNFGSDNFTIDFWIYQTGGTGYCSKRWEGAGGWRFRGSTSYVRLDAKVGGTWYEDMLHTSSGVTYNTWTHIALVRNGDNWYIFINGELKGSTTKSGALDAPNNYFAIGATADSGENTFQGYIDEFRVSKGIARWTTDFTPPTKEYSSEIEDTIPALTDTDSLLAPTINHVFPGYLTDSDTFLIPSINHVFPGTLADTDTFRAPAYGVVLNVSVYLAETDTATAPGYGRAERLTSGIPDSDIMIPPRVDGLPVPRHRVKVNY